MLDMALPRFFIGKRWLSVAVRFGVLESGVWFPDAVHLLVVCVRTGPGRVVSDSVCCCPIIRTIGGVDERAISIPDGTNLLEHTSQEMPWT